MTRLQRRRIAINGPGGDDEPEEHPPLPPDEEPPAPVKDPRPPAPEVDDPEPHPPARATTRWLDDVSRLR